MKKWYQSSVCKGLLLLVAHVSAVALAICIGIGLFYPDKITVRFSWIREPGSMKIQEDFPMHYKKKHGIFWLCQVIRKFFAQKENMIRKK